MFKKIERFLDWFSKAKTWKKAVMTLSSLVVFVTVYALILPAITVENRVICGNEEHTHSEACYTTQATLVCENTDPDHEHSSDCYEYTQVLTCTIPEHTHTDECYESVADAIVDELTGNDEETPAADTTEETEVIETTEDTENSEALDEEETEDKEEESKDDEESKDEEESEDDEESKDEEESEDEEETEDEEESEKEIQEFTLTAILSDGNTVTVTGTNEVLPEEVEDLEQLTLVAEMLEDAKVDEMMDGIGTEDLGEDEKPSDIYDLYDIKLYYDGEEIEPTGTLTLSITGIDDIENVEDVEFFHLDEENNKKEDINFELTAEGTLTAETDHFSVYGITNKTAEGNAINSADDFTNLKNGGTYYLNADIEVKTCVTITKDTTLNLNGHTLTYTGSNHLFNITGGTLTIMDGEEKAETVTSASGDLYGKDASYSNGKLTYYVTESTVSNSETGATTESLQEHTVIAAGKIVQGEKSTSSLINVNGGSLVLTSGMLTSSTTNVDARAITQTSGTTTLQGGYICNFKNTETERTDSTGGGAILLQGGTLNLTTGTNNAATVIAANNAAGGGAIYLMNSATLNMSNGIFSGNYAIGTSGWAGGGAIYSTDTSTMNISGGYLTNNKTTTNGDYYINGGAIYLSDSSTLNLSGTAKLTGNKSNGGGAIGTINGQWYADANTQVNITGGYICSNVATACEGGGIRLEEDGKMYLSSGYINNNKCLTNEHWGGGGIFIANGGVAQVVNGLVTGNTAEGLGGGVAGCSTGRILIAPDESIGLFSNTANGTNFSGDASTKSEDHTYGKDDEFFMKYGYSDYYCALASTVYPNMIGGGLANWSGSADGVPVSNVTDVLAAQSVMGLTAHPDSTTTQAAIAAVKSASGVYINGNYSNIHGGGIMCNGTLTIGRTNEIDLGSRIELEGIKTLKDASGDVAMTAGEFTFQVIDERNTVVSTGTNDANGTITFDKRLSFDAEGTYKYTIKEVVSSEAEIITDSNVYTLTVEIKMMPLDDFSPSAGVTIKQYYYYISSVEMTNSAGTTVYSHTLDPNNTNDGYLLKTLQSYPYKFNHTYIKSDHEKWNYTICTIDAYKYLKFNNVKNDSINITAKKEWATGSNKTEIKADLIRTKTNTTDNTSTSEVIDTQALNASNSWKYTWSKLPLTVTENNVKYTYSYSIEEEAISGYYATYSSTTSTGTTEGASYWVPATSLEVGKQYMIVNSGVTYALQITSGHENAGFTSSDKVAVTKNSGSITVNGTTYSNYIVNNNITDRAIFTAVTGTTNSGYKGTMLKCNGTTANSWLLIQKTDTSNLKGCSNIQYASLLSIQNSKLAGYYEWNQETMYYLTYASGVFTASTTNSNNVKLYTLVSTAGTITTDTVVTITNTPIEDVDYTLDITKRSASDTNIKLSNAKFQLINKSTGEALYFTGSNGNYKYSATKSDSTVSTVVTITRGKLYITGIPGGTYILRETEAPEGYSVVEDQEIVFDGTVKNKSITLNVDDPEGTPYELPETGGMGTTIIYIAGGALMAAAVILLIAKKRTEGKED